MKDLVQLEGNNRDAHVVEEICSYITATPSSSFFLFAGAGSGKTRTLVEVLRRTTGVVEHNSGSQYARQLRARGQSIRVVTYTKNATAVVTKRLGENDLTSVSTIHTFCWELIKGFNEDIRDALLALNAERLANAKMKASEKKKGETAKDREKYAEIEADAEDISQIVEFIYHPDHDTYGRGALAHADVLSVAAWLIRNRPTLRRILIDRHPLILIDESQDTMRKVLDALLELSAAHPTQIVLGLLGDHRQRIYLDGHEDLPSLVPENWKRPSLKMNHRSQKRIVELINKIWEADVEGRTQSKTGVRQHWRTEKDQGTVRIFVGDAATETARKIQAESKCALIMGTATNCRSWDAEVSDYKTLALEHKLAAKRGRFFEAFSAMELLDKDASTPKSNGDRSGPSIIRPLLGPMLDLAECVSTDGVLDEQGAMDVLRANGLLEKLPESVEERHVVTDRIHAAVTSFITASLRENATVQEVLRPVLEGDLFATDHRLLQAYRELNQKPASSQGDESIAESRRAGWEALFACPWRQMKLYRAYLAGEAELATHQVVKGSEFSHVMVVMDDEEAGGTLFSYDKLLGAEDLSSADRKNIDDGKETTVDRTLRLLYVTCSRAEESLALILWARNPSKALESIKQSEWFTAEEVVDLNPLLNHPATLTND